MIRHIQIVLLVLILAAFVCDIAIHSYTVLAQAPAAPPPSAPTSASTLHVDAISHQHLFSVKAHSEVDVRGTQVVGFACQGDYCYVLSK